MEKAKKPHLQPTGDIDAIGVTIGKRIEGLLPVLFNYYLGVLQRKYKNNEKIQELGERYRKDTRKYLGDYIGFKREQGEPNEKCGFLTELMYIIKGDTALTNYCKGDLGSDEILTLSQIAEIGMCVIYRNLFAHDDIYKRWTNHKGNGNRNLLKMDNDACAHWEENWNSVIDSVEERKDLPKHEMLQKMAVFCQPFLNMLFDEQIYPKVIVMTSSSTDQYGTHIISADSSNPDDETLFLTDRDFKPLTQFYYRPRTNPADIEPILAPKDTEKLVEWATNPKMDTENQEKA